MVIMLKEVSAICVNWFLYKVIMAKVIAKGVLQKGWIFQMLFAHWIPHHPLHH